MTPAVVLFSSGLDSAVLLAEAARRPHGVQPVYVSAGLAWEADERRMAERFLSALGASERVRPLVQLAVDMRDVYPAAHWAIRGAAPAFDTPDSDVYLEGRNIVLLSKAGVFAAQAKLDTILLGTLAGNPFPDARPEFFEAFARALTLGLDAPITIETPFAALHKDEVVRRGHALGVPFALTLSCMQPVQGTHCGRCSKCRERRDAFRAAGIEDQGRSVGP
jgi:7-cyano-7-deazaguanine synthase